MGLTTKNHRPLLSGVAVGGSSITSTVLRGGPGTFTALARRNSDGTPVLAAQRLGLV